MSKRAAIYCRVSTDAQRDNYSIPSQLAECLNYANKMGYTIVGDKYVDPRTGKDTATSENAIPAFVDDYSSLELYRPGLDAVYDYLSKKGFDILVVYSIDRLDRDPYKLRIHEYGIVKHGAAVEYVKGEYSDTPEGQFLKNVIASAAQLENEWRTERFSRGKRRKAYMGKILGYWVPYGYQVDKNAPAGLSILENQAEIITRIFHWYADTYASVRKIVKMLNEIPEYKPSRGTLWAKSSILRILRNTAYIGYIYWNKSKVIGGLDVKKKRTKRDKQEWIRINIPAIIDENLFQAAQERLKYAAKLVRRTGIHKNLLSGMIICEECGKAYIGDYRKARIENREVNDRMQYRHRVKSGHCSNHVISARFLDKAVWDKIVEFLLYPDTLIEGYRQAIEKGKMENQREFALLDELSKAEGKYEKRLKNLITAYTDPDIGIQKEDFIEQKQLIEKEITNIQARIKEIKSTLSELPTLEDLKNLEDFSVDIRERLINPNWQPSYENKRWVMNKLKIKVLVSGDQYIKITGIIGNAPVLLDKTSTYYDHLRLPLRMHV
jgi:site-specific DNA recombinase